MYTCVNLLRLRAIQCAREVLIRVHISAGSRFQSSSRYFLMHIKKESEVLSEGDMRPRLILTRFAFIARSCLRFKFLLRYVFIFLLFSLKADLKCSCKICLRSSSVSFFFESLWSLNKRSGMFTSPIFCFLPEPLPSVNVVPPPAKERS